MCRNQNDVADFSHSLKLAKLRLLRMHFESGVGHIGGNLSCLDAILWLYRNVLRPNDLFVLSKGHAAGALYVALWSTGRLREEELSQFHGEGTRLPGHPIPWFSDRMPFATGSLGHGLPVASGIALGKRIAGEAGRIYCLTSDGEWQEGSNWEALIFGRHHRLDNLTILVDVNGLQGFGSTAETASLADLEGHFTSFGLDVEVVDGHDPGKFGPAIECRSAGGPQVVFLRTVKGKGVSFMENRLEWHYLPLSESQYRAAVEEIAAS